MIDLDELIYRRQLEARFVLWLTDNTATERERAVVLRQIIPALRGEGIDTDSAIARDFAVAHTTVGDTRDALLRAVVGEGYGAGQRASRQRR